MVQIFIYVEQLQAGLSVNAYQVIFHRFPAASQTIQFLVTEADFRIVFDCTAEIDFVDPCPHDGIQAHRAGLSRGIQITPGQIVCLQALLSISDRGDLPVCGGIIVCDHHIVAFSDDLSVLDDHTSEGTAVPAVYSLQSL